MRLEQHEDEKRMMIKELGLHEEGEDFEEKDFSNEEEIEVRN